MLLNLPHRIKAGIFLTMALAAATTADAQSWQWGKRGGSSSASGSNGLPETILDIANDPYGNIYALTITNKNGLDIDGHSKTGYGYNDATLVSFGCNGNYRWSKVIGSYNGGRGYAVKTDGADGVYVIGAVSSTSSLGYAHFDTDTTLGYTTKKLYLIKYDTSGTYKWLKMPEADTVTNPLNYNIDLQVDAAGNVFWLTRLMPGAYANGSFVNSATSVQILKYNATGSFVGNFPLPIQGSLTDLTNVSMTRSSSGKYYLTGANLTLSGTNYPKPFVAAFGSTGTLLWAKQGSGNMSINGRPAIDGSARLYITGGIFNGDRFNGYTASQSGIYGAPFVSALDTNGGPVWIAYATSNGSSAGRAIVSKGNEIMITGEYPGHLKWIGASDSLKQASNSGYNTFVARFNAATGAYVKMDSIYSPVGANEFGTAISVDENGFFFIGGSFENQINVAHDTLISNGGETDFFVAKYGLPCGCTSAPVANFSFGYSGKAIQFTYNGSTAQADSIVWSFGDGQRQTVKSGFTAPITHNYSTSGTYNVCATVYAYCGTATICKNVTATASGAVGSLSVLGNVRAYPNPAGSFLTIEGAQGAEAAITNSIGQQAMQFRIRAGRQVIDISSLPAGMYILQLTDARGNRGALSIVKE